MDYRYGAPQVGQQPWPQANQLPQRARRGWAAPAALVASIAALAVGTAALVQGRAEHATAVTTSTTSTAVGGGEAADRALCAAIAPLMAEDDKASNTWRNTGEPGTPARDAALAQFAADTRDWARRIQAVLDDHPAADGYIRRTLQRFIDDRLLFVANARPGPVTDVDKGIWNESLSAYGGPLAACSALGVTW